MIRYSHTVCPITAFSCSSESTGKRNPLPAPKYPAEQLHGGVVEIEVHERTAQHHAPDDGQDVPNVFAVGRKADHGEDAAQSGAIQVPAHQEDVAGAHQAVHPHVHQNGTGSATCGSISTR